MDKTFTIPSPIGGTFAVIIKNSAGATVFSHTESNAPFTVTGLSADDYILYARVNGKENGWCFNVPDCTTCPVLIDVVVRNVSGSYYADFNFDMIGGFDCPFILSGSSTAGFPYSLTINSLLEFTSHIGSTYTKTFLIGGAPGISYNVSLVNGTLCTSGNATYICDSPILHAYTLSTRNGSGHIYLDIEYVGCGSTCHTVTWNYLQTSPASGSFLPEAGTIIHTVSCAGLPNTYSIEVHPNCNTSGGSPCSGPIDVKYRFQYIDCCGITGTIIVDFGIITFPL